MTDNANEAEILRAALNGQGMKCEISGENQAGFTGIGVMKIRLFVSPDEFDRAQAFLEQHHHGS